MTNFHKIKSIYMVAICSTLTASCAIDPRTGQPSFKETFASDDPCANNARNIGVLAGAVLGAAAGQAVKGNRNGTLVGAGVGALAGGLIGADMDRRRCALSKIAKKYGVEMQVSDVQVAANGVAGQAVAGQQQAKSESVGLSVSLQDREVDGHFKSGSDELQPAARAYFGEIADQYSYAKQTALLSSQTSAEDRKAVEELRTKRILLIGHTDDTGGSRVNADLSERRAKTVADVFRSAGISESQLFFQGAGETLPIADNHTAEGRTKNRRVEIVDLSDETKFQNYLASRKPRIDYYRPVDAIAVTQFATATQTSQTRTGSDTANSAPPAKPPANTGQTKVTANPSAAKTPATAVPKTSSQPSVTPAPTTRVAVSASKNAPTGSGSFFDFGGTPALRQKLAVDIGDIVAERPGFSLISSAYADAPLIADCGADRPRVANGVKSLRDGNEIKTSEYVPGLYDTSWTDMVGGQLVALTHVAVLRDGAAPARRPDLLIYKNYQATNAARVKPDFTSQPEVNTYRGDKALLYRVFVGGPISCMDIVIPISSPTIAQGSWLHYDRNGQPLATAFSPRLAKSK